MRSTTRNHSMIIENMVTQLCDHLDEKYGLDPEMRSAMQESPSAALLDRAMAFRAEPWYSDVESSPGTC